MRDALDSGRARLGAAARRATVIAVIGLGLATAPAGAATMVSSTFDTDTDGWGQRVIDCNFGQGGLVIVGGPAPTWLHGGGNPAGFARLAAPADNWWSYWTAPLKFRGNQSASLGGSLFFDLRSDVPLEHAHTCSGFVGDVELTGASRKLEYDVPGPTMRAGAWHRVQVPWSAAGWRYFGGQLPVSDADFAAVVGSLEQVRIRAEWSFAANVDDLDNVMLQSADTAPLCRRVVVAPEESCH
jgi:hypothetical protein